jgi:hypothetical protein
MVCRIDAGRNRTVAHLKDFPIFQDDSGPASVVDPCFAAFGAHDGLLQHRSLSVIAEECQIFVRPFTLRGAGTGDNLISCFSLESPLIGMIHDRRRPGTGPDQHGHRHDCQTGQPRAERMTIKDHRKAPPQAEAS